MDRTRLAAVRRDAAAVAYGGAVFIGLMLLLAGAAVVLGVVERPGADGRVALTGWLWLENVCGVIAGAVGGWVCARWARRFAPVAWLAGVVFTLGLMETVAVVRALGAGAAEGDVRLALVAPTVAGVSALAGGWMCGGAWRRRAVTAVRAVRANEAIRLAAPLAALVGAALVGVFGMPTARGETNEPVVAAALAADLTILPGVLAYALWVRTKRKPIVVLLPLFAAGYALAWVLIPREEQAALEVIRLAAVPVEIAVVVYLLVLVRRAVAVDVGGGAEPAPGEDFVTRLRRNARGLLGARVPADVITTEVAILYYAIRRRERAENGERGRVFTTHRTSGYLTMLVALLMVSLVEIIPVHLLVGLLSPALAWALSGLTLYGVVWIIGDYRAITARPVVIADGRLFVRLGLRREAEAPLGMVEGVERIGWADAQKPPEGALTAALLGRPNVRIALREPVEVTGMYGLRKRANELWLRVDDPRGLASEMQRPQREAEDGAADER